MAYKYKVYKGIVFFDDDSKKKKSKNAFEQRKDFGRVDELELIKYLNKFFKKHKEKYSHIKVWDSKDFQEDVIGIRKSNILDTELGDVILRREYKKDKQILARFDVKRSKTIDENASASYHNVPTEFFNSDWNTFYATKKNNEWFVVWGQDLVMIIPEGIDINTGNRWWTKNQLSNYLIPLDDILHLLLNNDDTLIKCDKIEALREKYNYIKPKSVEQIEFDMKEPKETVTTVFKKISKTKVESKDIDIILNSKTPGYYATVPLEQCLNAENSLDNIRFILNYCPREGESNKDPVLVEFNDIKSVWRNLLVKNAFIRSKDLASYFKKT